MIFTFDPFYSPSVSNQFMEDYVSKGGKYRTYIMSQPPYHWYYEVKDSDAPKFLKYKLADGYAKRTMLPKLKAITPSDEVYLKRLVRSPADFERFVSPNVFKKARVVDYFVVFRFKSIAELTNISSQIGVKIYIFPKKVKNLLVACCFNKMIRNFVFQHNILLEKTNKSQYSGPGEIEFVLNTTKFSNEKIQFKTRKLAYVEDGIYRPLAFTNILSQ